MVIMVSLSIVTSCSTHCDERIGMSNMFENMDKMNRL